MKAGRGVPVEAHGQTRRRKATTLDEIKSRRAVSTRLPAVRRRWRLAESEADKAKREELLRKNKEIEEGNKKIRAANAIIARTFKAGNEHLTAATAASKAKTQRAGYSEVHGGYGAV